MTARLGTMSVDAFTIGLGGVSTTNINIGTTSISPLQNITIGTYGSEVDIKTSPFTPATVNGSTILTQNMFNVGINQFYI